MNKTLEHAMCCLNMEFGEGTIKRASECTPAYWRTYSTGNAQLDAALGIDGLPAGKIVEIYGPDYTGKTSLALQIARQVDNALYIDADYGLNPNYARGLYLAHVDTLEGALKMVETAARAFDLVVIDTLTALPTAQQAEARMDNYSRAESQAKVLSRCLPRIIPTLSRYGCTLALVNQVREKSAVCFGNPEHSTGGRALKHYAAVRLEVRQGRITVTKNKCAPACGKVAACWMN